MHSEDGTAELKAEVVDNRSFHEYSLSPPFRRSLHANVLLQIDLLFLMKSSQPTPRSAEAVIGHANDQHVRYERRTEHNQISPIGHTNIGHVLCLSFVICNRT